MKNIFIITILTFFVVSARADLLPSDSLMRTPVGSNIVITNDNFYIPANTTFGNFIEGVLQWEEIEEDLNSICLFIVVSKPYARFININTPLEINNVSRSVMTPFHIRLNFKHEDVVALKCKLMETEPTFQLLYDSVGEWLKIEFSEPVILPIPGKFFPRPPLLY